MSRAWTTERHEELKVRADRWTNTGPVLLSRNLRDALAEIALLQERLFGIVVGLEPYDARDSESGECSVCYAGYGVPHEEDCGYKAGLEYCKRTRPEMWGEEAADAV